MFLMMALNVKPLHPLKIQINKKKRKIIVAKKAATWVSTIDTIKWLQIALQRSKAISLCLFKNIHHDHKYIDPQDHTQIQ
jgi:hypothetical protein